MIRIYRYTSPYEFQDFETHIFTTLLPKLDAANDRLYINGTDYRISTINYIGLFNRLVDNQASYTITFGDLDATWAVLSNNQNFTLILNPKLHGCVLNLKLKKTTAEDLLITLPSTSFGKDITNNTITLTGTINSTYILTAIYENGEYDWLNRSRSDGYGGSTGVIPDAQIQSDWNQILNTALDYIKNKPDLTLKADKSSITRGFSFNDSATLGIDYYSDNVSITSITVRNIDTLEYSLDGTSYSVLSLSTGLPFAVSGDIYWRITYSSGKTQAFLAIIGSKI